MIDHDDPSGCKGCEYEEMEWLCNGRVCHQHEQNKERKVLEARVADLEAKNLLLTAVNKSLKATLHVIGEEGWPNKIETIKIVANIALERAGGV